MSGVVRIVGWLIPLSLAQAAIVAAGVWLALRALPGERGRLRHGIAVAALAIVTGAFLSTAGLLLLDWSEHVSCWSGAGEPRGAVSVECRIHGVPVPAGAEPVDPAEKAAALPAWRSMIHVPSVPGERAVARAWTGVAGIVGAAWLAVLLLLGLRELRDRRAIRAIRRGSVPIRKESVSATVDDLVDRLGICSPVEVRESRAVETPCVVGAGRPLILMPWGLLAALDRCEVRGVLAHELEHVRRRDVLALSLQRAAESLLFFNPFAIWISRRAREEREAACDRIGAEVGTGSRTDYARMLLLLEGFRSAPLTTARLPALLGEGGLAGRVERLLTKSPAVRRSVRAAAIALALAATLVGGALVQATFAGASLGTWAVMAEDNRHRTNQPE